MFREWEVSITEYFSSVLRAKIKWKDVYFSRTSQYFLVLLGTSSYFSRTSWYFSVLLGTFQYFLVLLGTSQYFCTSEVQKSAFSPLIESHGNALIQKDALHKSHSKNLTFPKNFVALNKMLFSAFKAKTIGLMVMKCVFWKLAPTNSYHQNTTVTHLSTFF